jgi:protease-4
MKRTVCLALTIAAATACGGREKGKAASPPPEPRKGPALAIIDLSQGLPEEPSSNMIGLPSRKPKFLETVRTIEKLAKKEEVKGIYVSLGSAAIGLSKADELASTLIKLRDGGKKVFCHADGYTNATLMLATRACSVISMPPAGEVENIGIAAQVVYFRKLLDTLKVHIDILQVGQFKGAEESITRDGPSPQARESLESTLAGLRRHWLARIREGRPKLEESVIEDGPYFPERAKALGVVDAIAYDDEARTKAKEACGAVRTLEVVGAGAQKEGEGLAEILRAIGGGGSAPVAVIRATGSISASDRGAGTGIGEKRITRLIERAEKDEAIKVVVLRIDSPGGSALASDLMWHGLMRLRAKKKIIVSVGEMAASGGYYLASAGDEIFAHPTSIVGSIGVVGGKLSIANSLEHVGVHSVTFAAKAGDPRAASRAAYLSLLDPWDEPTRARVFEGMSSVYELFLRRILEGRAGKIVRQELEQSAEGRIFSGDEALKRKLVDKLGGVREALARAAELAGSPVDGPVTVLGEETGFLSVLGGEDGSGPLGQAGPVDDATSEYLGRLAAPIVGRTPALDQLTAVALPLLRGEKMLCVLPFGVSVQ